jgi:formylglycine-generating enzyme required for sulfatase activity
MFLATASGSTSLASDEDPKDAKIASLIEQLGDPTFATREAASKALAGLDESALPIVRSAAESHPDAEIRGRASRAVREIMRGNSTSKSTGMKLALIEAGTFRMGSDQRRRRRFLFADEMGHDVAITEPYLLGVYEVTQDEYRQVMKVEPSAFSRTGNSRDKVAALETERFPVEQVSWFDAVEFCNRLSALDGFPPYYEIADVKRDVSITSAQVSIGGGSGYHLPTEAQWEFACRGGTVGRFHYGEENTGIEANLQSYDRFNDPLFDSLDRPTRVGSYAPNAWGLHDMHGNIGEWCWDWYDEDYYSVSPPKDPPGPDRGDQRVVRGGAWNRNEDDCRSSSRSCLSPDEHRNSNGFRVCRMP